MDLNIELPQYNGNFEAGIAVGIDPALPDLEKLHCHTIPDAEIVTR